MTDKAFRANDPKQVKARQDKAALVKQQQEEDLQELIALPAFRRYVWRHLHETCGLMKDPFSPNGSIQTHNLGMHSVARALWSEVERVDPLAIPKMMTEHWESNK